MPPVPVGPRTTDSRDIRPARSWDGRLPGISPSCHGHVRHSPIQGKDLRPTSASCRGCPSRRCRSQPTVTEKTSFRKSSPAWSSPSITPSPRWSTRANGSPPIPTSAACAPRRMSLGGVQGIHCCPEAARFSAGSQDATGPKSAEARRQDEDL